MEDRPAVKERVTLMKEHRPVEREYVVSGSSPVGGPGCLGKLFEQPQVLREQSWG